MNLLYGTVTEIFEQEGLRVGRIRVGGALKVVALELVRNAAVGDVVLICDGVAIEKVQEETDHVSSHSR